MEVDSNGISQDKALNWIVLLFTPSSQYGSLSLNADFVLDFLTYMSCQSATYEPCMAWFVPLWACRTNGSFVSGNLRHDLEF